MDIQSIQVLDNTMVQYCKSLHQREMAVKSAEKAAAAPSSRVAQELDLQEEVDNMMELREDQVRILILLL